MRDSRMSDSGSVISDKGFGYTVVPTMTRHLSFTVVCALALGLIGSAQSPKGTSLFNGKDLSGWKIPTGDNGHWKVMDGVIDYDAESESTAADKSLWSDKSYG